MPQSDFVQRCVMVCMCAQWSGGRRRPSALLLGIALRGRGVSRERDVSLQSSASIALACSVPGERRVAGESTSWRGTGTASPFFSVFKFSAFWLCYMWNRGLMAEPWLALHFIQVTVWLVHAGRIRSSIVFWALNASPCPSACLCSHISQERCFCLVKHRRHSVCKEGAADDVHCLSSCLPTPPTST